MTPHTILAREWMELHVDALYTYDANGRLLCVRAHDGALAPRFFVGRVSDGSIVRRYRYDVDDALRRALEAASADVAFPLSANPEVRATAELARYTDILGRSGPVERMEAGPAFAFPESLPAHLERTDDAIQLVTEENVRILEPLLPAWIPDVQLSPPLLALVVDGAAVSVCGSVRITPRAHEAGVDTVQAYRGRGYAPRVVAAWARAVRDLGAEPLYSTSWKNAASRAVARKLALMQFGSDIHLT